MELEHLKIETRLIDENFANTMGGKPRGESGRMLPYLIALTEHLKLQKSGHFPDEPIRIKF